MKAAARAWPYSCKLLRNRIVSVQATMGPVKKFYAVRKGRSIGIFSTWPECQDQVHGYSAAQYKSFNTLAEAEAYLAGGKNAGSGGGSAVGGGQQDLRAGRHDQARPVKRYEPFPQTRPDSRAQQLTTPQQQFQQDPLAYVPEREGSASGKPVPSFPTTFHAPTTFTAAAARGRPTAEQVLELCRACASAACDEPIPDVSSTPLTYQVNFDGASRGNPGAAGSGAVIVEIKTGNEIVRLACPLPFGCTNNEAEYAGLILGLEACANLGIKQPIIRGDSQLVINQVTGKWNTNQPHLLPYRQAVLDLMAQVDAPAPKHVYRSENQAADELSNTAVDLSLQNGSHH